MPYVQYLDSASTSAYLSATFSKSTTYTFIYTGNITESAGNYGGAAMQSGTYYNPAGGESPASNSGAERIEEIRGTTYSDNSFSASGSSVREYNGNDEDAYSNKGMQSFHSFSSYTASGIWDGTQIVSEGSSTYSTSYTTGGTNNTGEVYGNSDSGETVNEVNVNIIGYFLGYITTVTSSAVTIRKTTESTATFYGPLEESETTYTYVYPETIEHTFTNIKTLTQSELFWDVEYQSKTFNIEWLGYSGGGAQNLGLVYTATAVSKDISAYDAVLMETDSFSSSNQRESFAYGASFDDEYDGDTYTLTYDIITTATIASQTTILDKELFYFINSFYYGFISTYTTGTTIYTAGTSSETIELTSASKGFVYTYDSDAFAVSGVSYSAIQAISTTSNFTQFVELSGLNKATSFIVRSFVTTTASYTHRGNAYGASVDGGGNPDGRSYSFAPVFPESALVIRSPENTNPDTFYTEKASFASFAEPNYSTAFRGYSPAKASLVFLALVPLNDTAEEGKYPSWISVYDGTFSGNDREQSTLESVTAYQSSSYVGSGATNVYQTITFFINNNSASQTTKTTSIAMNLANSASSVSRLVRATAENLDSAYGADYLPSIPLVGLHVVFTQGIHSDASYNINRMLLNAYTTAKSTFAGSATSSFPISVSGMPYPIYRNKIRIDSAYGAIDFNSFAVNLQQFGAGAEEE